MSRNHIEEGTIFALPLNDGRYAVGVVTRRAPKRGKTWGVFAYFFGPYIAVPSSPAFRDLRRDCAVALMNCGALHFHSGKWRAVGKLTSWNRDEWPLPDFCRYERHTQRFFRVRYGESDLATVIGETPMPDNAAGLPEDTLYGAEAAEIS
jgi:hypothetical protein